MANNIGIKVDVAFPSASELQTALETAWAKVKNNVDVNIKLGVNKTEMQALKTSIKNALNEDIYEIQVSTKDATKDLEKMFSVIERIDKELKQERKLKVNLDVVNLQSSLKDLLGSMEKVQKESKNILSEGMRGFNEELKNADKNFTALTRKQKLNRDGSIIASTTTQTKKDDLGATEKVTFRETSSGMTADVELLYKKETALKAVEKEMKELYDLEKKMQKAQQDGDQGTYNRYEKERDAQVQNVLSIKKDYEERYGETASASDTIKDLQKRYVLERDILTLKKQHTDSVKAEKEAQEKAKAEEQARQAKINSEMKEYENTINNAFGEYVKHTKEIYDTNEKLEKSTGVHREELEKKLQSLMNNRAELAQEHDLLNVINDEQRKQIKNLNEKLTQEGRIKTAQEQERDRLKAISDNMTEYEHTINRAFGSYKESLKETGRLNKELEKATGEHKEELERQLSIQNSKQRKLEEEHNLLNVINDTQKEEIGTIKEKLKLSEREREAKEFEKELNDEITKELKEQERAINNAYEAYVKNTKELSSTYESMEKATGRHKEALKEQFNVLLKKRDKLEEEYDILNKMSSEQKEQLHALREQLHYSEKIRSAKDREMQKMSDLKNATSKIAQLERERFDIQKQLINATDGQKDSLRDLDNYYKNFIDKIKRGVDFEKDASYEQKKQLETLKDIQGLKINILEAKKRESEYTEKERNALARAKSIKQEILSIEEKIAKLEGLKGKDGTEAKLDSLKHALMLVNEEQRALMKNYESETKITDAIKDQNRLLEHGSKIRMEQIANDNKIQSNQEEANNLLKDYQNTLRNIGSLQRDLVFAGDREKLIIEQALAIEGRKLDTMRDEISASRHISDERKRELDMIEKAQAEQLRLNNLRQDAREIDRVYDNAYGVTDFQSYISNMSQGFREVLDGVARIDEAYMRVKKVAEATEEDLQAFKDSSYDVASSLGVVADDYMMAVEKWVTAGYTLEESQELGQVSTIGAFVGNIDTDLMAKWLSVPLNTYKDDLLSSNDIVNVMNETANNHAIEMEELGKAYMRGANSAKTAGVSFEELTGMIAGAQEATRLGGERIGTSMKTISANFLQLKSPTTPAQQKKTDLFKAHGIDITKAESLTDVLGEVNGIWSGLEDTERNALVLALAGKEHANVLTAIINEWETVKEASSDANFQLGLETDGSAYKEFNEQKDSVRFQLAELENAWLELMNTIGESDGLVKNVLDALTKGLQKLNDIAENERLMELLKLILIGVGFHAGTNGILRVIDLMDTGIQNVKKNTLDFIGLLRGGASLIGLGGKGKNNGSNSSDNGSKKDSNDNGGDGVSVVGVGSSSVGKKKKKGKKDDGDDKEITRKLEESENKFEKQKSKITGTVAKGAKTVISMIPIVGNALLVAELLGVDVFGKVGSLLSSVTKSTNDYAKESMEALDSLEKSNMLTNGDMDILKNESKTGDYSWLQKAQEAVDSKKGLSEEDFLAIKEGYNNRVKELGLQEFSEIDLEITWNDSEDVLNKINEYNKALEKLAEKEAKDLAKGYVKELPEIDKSKEDVDSKIKEQEERVESINKSLEKARANLEKAEKDGDEGKIKAFERQIENLEVQYDKFNGRLEKSKETQKEINEFYESLGDSMSKMNVEDLENLLLSIESEEELATVVRELGNAHAEAYSDVLKLREAQYLLGKGSDLTREQFHNLMDTLGLTNKEIEGLSYENYISENGEVRASIDSVINKLLSEALEAEKTADRAVTAGEKIKNGLAKGGEGADTAKTAVQELGTSVSNLPSFKKIEIQVTQKMEKFNELASNLNGSGFRIQKSVSTKPVTKGVVSANVSTSQNEEAVTSNATSTTKAKTNDKAKTNSATSTTDANAKISQDVWRYWRTEDKQTKLETVMSDLTRAIEEAGSDSKKLANLYQKQLKNIQSQKASVETLKKGKTNEAQQRLSQLTAYGFKVNKKDLTISNLESQAKKLTGTKATEAEDLLNQWRTLVGEIQGFDEQLKDLKEQEKDVKIEKELNSYATLFKRMERSLRTVDNRNALNESYLGLVDSMDSELHMQVLSKSAYDASDSMNRMLDNFNIMSNSQVKNVEVAEELHSKMSTLKDDMLSNADAVIEYNQSLNDLEMERAVNDINKYNEAVTALKDNLSNTRENVQEGLLSGTKLSDLQSTQTAMLDLSRNNKLDKMAQQRLELEKSLQLALDNFAEKNIVRELKVANETLKINKDKYNELLKYETDYNDGKYITQYTEIFAEFNKATEDMDYSLDKGLTKFYQDLYKMQEELNKKYEKGLSSDNYEERLEAEYQYGLESLKIENEINKKRIETANANIEEFNRQLKDDSLTQTQSDTIISQIQSEKESIIDLQNSIKDNIQTLYDFQLGQIDTLLSKYDEMVSSLEYSLSLVQAINPNELNAQYAILESMKDNEILRKGSLRNSIESLKAEMALLDQGSYEWNILNSKVSEYNGLLLDANKSILDMNSQLQANQLDNIVGKFEKKLFGGKTSEQFQQYQDLWLTGLERELALEEMYQKIADLGTDNFKDKMALLEKQDKISRLEADYLMKQMEIYELQKGLEEGREQRAVKTLQQNTDGTFQWNYVADDTAVEEQSMKIKQAQIELMNMENDAKNSYLSQLQDIVANIQANQYSSKDELASEMSQLESAYELILGDIPATMKNLSAEILYAYEQAKLGNEDLLNELSQNGNAQPVVTTITNLEESLVRELKTLGDRIEKAVRDSLVKSGNYSNGVFTSSNVSTAKPTDSSTSITIDRLEFPNATSSDEIRKALVNLPQYAMQYAKSKK